MFTFQKIPVEIHSIILDLLPKESIYECMFVNKYWASLSIPIYYQAIYLSGAQIEYLNSKLLLSDKDQDQQFEYGKHVKALISPEFPCSFQQDPRFIHYNSEPEDTIDDDNDNDDDDYYYDGYLEDGAEDEDDGDDDELDNFEMIPVFSSQAFLKLLSYLPNLKKIDLFTSAYYEFYMTILISQGKKYLHHLQEISIHDAYHELHFAVCYEFKHTLTHLVVYYATYYVDHLFGDPIYFLPHFKSLTHLTCRNFERQDLSIFHLLEICPHLTSLEFDSNFHVLDHDLIIPFKKIKKQQLKVLDLTLPQLSNCYLLYITHHTAHLNSLSITLFDSHFDDWIKRSHSTSIVLDFIHRLRTIPRLSFCTRFVSSSTFNLNNQVIEIDCFQDFLDSIIHYHPNLEIQKE